MSGGRRTRPRPCGARPGGRGPSARTRRSWSRRSELLAEHGFQQLTMEQVARRAGSGQGDDLPPLARQGGSLVKDAIRYFATAACRCRTPGSLAGDYAALARGGGDRRGARPQRGPAHAAAALPGRPETPTCTPCSSAWLVRAAARGGMRTVLAPRDRPRRAAPRRSRPRVADRLLVGPHRLPLHHHRRRPWRPAAEVRPRACSPAVQAAFESTCHPSR